MIDAERPVDRLLRRLDCDPLCRDCDKCGPRWLQVWDRLESQCSRPVMMALLAVFVALVVLVLGCCFADAVAGTVSSGVVG